MMKRLKLSLLIVSVSLGMMAQISAPLKEMMSQGDKEFIRVKVLFESNTSILEERGKWQMKGIPVDRWPQLVNRSLMKEAARSQTSAKKLLELCDQSAFRNVESFYIVNMMILEARPALIYKLYALPEVNYIDLANEKWELIEPELIGTVESSSTIGMEPGLSAINAEPMWKMGYTGKGGIAYDYDTGVWPSHPAYSGRFLANYAPMSQAWYGYYNPLPTGATGDHGTHVLGTIAGLNEQSGDTIGVAFGAYWIANDLIGNASIAADLPPLAEMVKGFEWALNPDGDTSTSNDVPDVINNSWRWRDIIDTVHCGGFIVDLMNAIEAAGIANVFSGGNTGPNNNGVNSPQRINTSEVNTFTVGSVNANVNFPYPISNFSTRGPTQCGGTGSLHIHPEVVAPGQNVRSAWGMDGYNTISGTSMASPHVSGAVLLLKEAFPQLSGDTLLYALYETAVDLGSAGEDNTYGNGIIDVYAAFQSLSQRYSSINPNNIQYDLAIDSVQLKLHQGLSCDSIVQVDFVIRNNSDTTIYQRSTRLERNGIPITPITSVGGGMPPDFSVQTGYFIPVQNAAISGDDEIAIVLLDPFNLDQYPINNRRMLRFNYRARQQLPFMENFEGGIVANRWHVKNIDNAQTWDTVRVPDGGTQKLAAYMNFLDYKPRANQKDQLWTPQLSIPTGGPVSIKFDLAYQEYVPVNILYDTLKVLVSTDCGATLQEVYKKFGPDLNTSGGSGPGFIPQDRSDWRRDSIDISGYAGQDILVVFEGINRNGNDLFLDNISIFQGTQDPMVLVENELKRIQVYPIPAKDELNISSSIDLTGMEYRVIDASGKLLITGKLNGGENAIGLNDLNRGIYTLKLFGKEFSEAHRFIKE